MDKNIYSQISSNQDRVKNKIRDFIYQNLIFVVLFFNISLEIVSKLYRVGFKNPFSIEFFLELSVSITTSMICYITFIPFGRHDERSKHPSFIENVTLWGKLSETVRNGHNNLFRLFCQEQVDAEREDKRRAIIGNNTLISYDEYISKYRGLSREEIKNLFKTGEICKKEAKAINKANGNTFINAIKVRPINPIIILSGVKRMQINDAGRSNYSYTLNWIFSRPIMIFVINALINSITTSFVGSWQNAVLDMLLSVLTVVLASVCGFSVGANSARYENDVTKSRILFLSLFAEQKNIVVQIPQKNALNKS